MSDHLLNPIKTGVVLINLGTPDGYKRKDIVSFLHEFLLDKMVVELPAFLWRPLLSLLVIPLRAKKLAKKYRSIWREDGSPLAIYTKNQVKKLAFLLSKSYDFLDVDYGMRYGRHSISETLNRMKESKVEQVLILPLYPQYASSTTGSAFNSVYSCISKMKNQLSLRFIKSFANHPGYIDTLAKKIKNHWENIGYPNFSNGDRLLLSFHGVPINSVSLGDPYYEECNTTALLLRHKLNLKDIECITTFQSRFGTQKWFEPYTIDKVIELARAGSKRLDIFCPGFSSDCLETLHEINIELRVLFEKAGGKFHFIPCLNDDEDWIIFLYTLVVQNLQGWC